MATSALWNSHKHWSLLTFHSIFKFSCVFQRSSAFHKKLKVQRTSDVFFSRHISLYNPQNINKRFQGKEIEYGDEMEHNISVQSVKHTQELQENVLFDVINKNQYLSNSEWDKLRNTVLNMGSTINEISIDGFIMRSCAKFCSFTTGKSYMKYLRNISSTPCNLGVLRNYLKLCYVCRPSCTEEDFTEIYNVYNYIKNNNSVLDANTAECIVLGLSVTKRWKDYTKYFEIIRETCTPTTNVYSAVVEAAFLNGDFKLGWEIMEEMIINDRKPTNNVYDLWLQITMNKNFSGGLEKLFTYLASYDIKLPKSLAMKIIETFDLNRRKSLSGSAFTSLTSRGVCKNCRVPLSQIALSTNEFNTLRNAFLNPVLIGKDIFLKTRPEEFSEYMKFLKKTSPYDVVLDGLNIAYAGGGRNNNPSVFCHMLSSVVAYFRNQSQKILVLGRKHMSKWPQSKMKYVYDNASVFLAEDLSHDDPFLLYATMYSGQHTHFVSRDLMRGHKFLLQDATLKLLFMRWQAQHQYMLLYVDNNGKANIRPPLPFSVGAQQSRNGAWHIPFEEEEGVNNVRPQYYNVYKNWLCLR